MMYSALNSSSFITRRLMWGALVSFPITLLWANPGWAQALTPTTTDTTPGRVLCLIASAMLGNVGRGLATIAVIMIGIGAMLGKVSWGIAMIVATGIAVAFGAPGIVAMILGTGIWCPIGGGGGGISPV